MSHPQAHILRAIADGKEVEFKVSKDQWQNMKVYNLINPLTKPEYEWRIKPENMVKYFVLIKNKSSFVGDIWKYDETNHPEIANLTVTYIDGIAIKSELRGDHVAT